MKSLRREVVNPAFAEHHGRFVKTTEDGMLVEFAYRGTHLGGSSVS